jgi:hypothetical protein
MEAEKVIEAFQEIAKHADHQEFVVRSWLGRLRCGKPSQSDVLRNVVTSRLPARLVVVVGNCDQDQPRDECGAYKRQFAKSGIGDREPDDCD